MRPWVLAALVLAVVLVAAIAFFRQQQPGPAANAYVIAFAGALTGTDAAVGEEQLRAVELAADTVNAAGGIGGRPLEIVSYDDANDPARAAEVARDIVANDRVVLVIGHTISWPVAGRGAHLRSCRLAGDQPVGDGGRLDGERSLVFPLDLHQS